MWGLDLALRHTALRFRQGIRFATTELLQQHHSRMRLNVNAGCIIVDSDAPNTTESYEACARHTAYLPCNTD